ncbi:MAG: 4'-phosphopantetheinyl transferase superfamily protein [Anaerovoracaceae bacterium]
MKLLYCNILDLPLNIDPLRETLPNSRQIKMDKYIQKDDQLRCLGAGLLLSYGLGEKYENYLSYNSYGKPILDMASKKRHFNLSHSGNYVVLAINSQPIGVDVQKHEDGDYIAMSKISFHTAEQKYLSSCENLQEAFYTFWTLKESYMKAVGMGFSLPPTSFIIDLTNKGPKLRVPNKYSLTLVPFHPKYTLAVCTKGDLPEINAELVEFIY